MGNTVERREISVILVEKGEGPLSYRRVWTGVLTFGLSERGGGGWVSLMMAAASGAFAEKEEEEKYVYRISTAEEWESLKASGSMFGGQLDKTTGCIHLSKLNQVCSTPSISVS